jgi:hypothetical protein
MNDCTEICCVLANENNSGKIELIKLLFQISSQKKQDEPSETIGEARPLKETKDFKISFHQNEPLLLLISRAPCG